jgi:type I restriction enzyme, S subunit
MNASTQTELGQLPPDWRVERFDALFSVQQGKQVSKKNRVGDNQHPFLRTKNVFWGRLDLTDLDEMHFTEAEEQRLGLQHGDLLVCEGGDIGRTAIWRNGVARCYYQNHLHRARARDISKVDSEFVLFWLWYAFEIGSVYFGRGNVTTIPNLSQSKLCELPLPVPPLAEQRKNAAVLGLLQRAMEQQERLLALTAEVKKALLHQLFADGLHHEPQKQTELGPIPRSWEMVELGSIAELINGFAFKSEDYVSEGVVNFRVVNIRDEGVIDVSNDIQFLPRSFMKTYERYLLSEGDILVVMVGATRGKLAFIPKSILPALMNQNMWRIVPISPEIHRRYLYHFLTTAVPTFVREFSESARGFFKKSDFRSIKIPKPSCDEQKEIADAIDDVNQKMDLHRRKHVAFSALFRTLLHELMTAQVRVSQIDLSELETLAASQPVTSAAASLAEETRAGVASRTA